MDSGVIVNSITYIEYLNQINTNGINNTRPKRDSFKPLDGALRCQDDNDYDCEAWDDFHGKKKPYILQLRNHINNFSWRYTITTSDLNSINQNRNLAYVFITSAASATPAAYAMKKLALYGVSLGTFAQTSINTGIVSTSLAYIFSHDTKSKLKVGDQLVVKGGEVIGIIRNGKSYTPAQIYGGRAGGGGGAGDGTGDDGNVEGGKEIGITPPPIRFCYRTFSNGQVIQVPCP
ncbi:hypothetical protein [Pseudoalteromonas sp. MMG005]|nr:hypothetical protein [Pseudoalteromonas sp. MMG005]MBQ4848256.1 hypothetical protein [Pseudoalteromonas sp. MMG005]